MKRAYLIKDDNDNVVNKIIASPQFMEANYSNYELAYKVFDERPHREWMQSEIDRMDALIEEDVNHPDLTHINAYKTALEGWPDTNDFPDTRPQSLEDRIANA